MATSETGVRTALIANMGGSDPADLKPMRTGVRTPRTKGTADEAAQAALLIAAQKACS